jgi:uncharacterized protein YjbI with pentapeptide repeats
MLHSSPGKTSSVLTHTVTTTTALSLADQQTTANIQLAQAQRAEALQLARAAQDGEAWWRQLITPLASLGAAAVTAIVAFLAIVLPLRNQRQREALQRKDAADKDRQDRKEAADKDRQDRKDAAIKDREQREKDITARFDAGFAAAVAAIGADNPVVQAGGAAALQSYLRADLAMFHDQVTLVVRANLDTSLAHPVAVRRLLVSALSQALRLKDGFSSKQAPRTRSFGRGDGRDLARTWLEGGDFRHVDLSSADLAYSDLAGARLDGARLRRSWGWETNLAGASLRGADMEEARFRGAYAPKAVLDKARLVSSRFEEATLTGARFWGAYLQSAHFNEAKLAGADFRHAKVSDAYFLGATFDAGALSSLLLSETWSPLGSPLTSEQKLRDLEHEIREHVDSSVADQLLAMARERRAVQSTPAR